MRQDVGVCISRIIGVGVDVDAAMAEATHPLHAHEGIDVEEEQVEQGHIAQLLPPVHGMAG